MLRRLKVIPLIAALCGAPLLFLPGSAAAGLEAGLGLSLTWPQDEFKEEVDFAWGGGFRLGYGFFEESAAGPSLFFDLSYLNYGRERRVAPFSLTIPEVAVDVVTDNYMVLVSPGVSIGVRRGWFRPYGEFFVGPTYIATRTKIEDRSLERKEIAGSTNFSDWAYHVGFGGGVKVPLWRRPGTSDTKEKKLSEVLLDLKFDYIKGGEAVYLKKGSIRRDDNGNYSYTYYESTTDLFQVRIGCSFRF